MNNNNIDINMSNEQSDQEDILSSQYYNLPRSEQEVSISFMRDDKYAIIYASDTTYITKLDKLCDISPDIYSVIETSKWGKTYRCEDKKLIGFRAKHREVSDEAKQAMSERMKKVRENRQKQE